MKNGDIHIGDIGTVGCVECQRDFHVSFATDTINVPRCPGCGTVVEGFEDNVDLKRNNAEVREALDVLERLLEDILTTMEERNRVPEGSSLAVLREIAPDLREASQYAAEQSRELNDSDD